LDCVFEIAERCLCACQCIQPRARQNRKLNLNPIQAQSGNRSNIALHSLAFGNIVFHSENGKLVVTITAACSARPEIT